MKTRRLWTREEESFRNIRWRGKCWTLAVAGGLLKLFLVLLYVYFYRQLISMWHQVHVYNGPVHWQIGDDCYSLVIRCSSTDNDMKMRFKTSNHPFADAVLGIQAFSTICALQLIVYQGTSKYQMMVVVEQETPCLFLLMPSSQNAPWMPPPPQLIRQIRRLLVERRRKDSPGKYIGGHVFYRFSRILH